MTNSLLWVRQLTERIYSLDPEDAVSFALILTWEFVTVLQVYPLNNLEKLPDGDRDAMESEAMNYFSGKPPAERSAYAFASMRLFEEARLATSEFNCADVFNTTLASVRWSQSNRVVLNIHSIPYHRKTCMRAPFI